MLGDQRVGAMLAPAALSAAWDVESLKVAGGD
jgi:hypothetical protein